MSTSREELLACENTDREIWRGPDEGNGSYYADSIHVTKDGGIGINCGGHVIVKPLREWHRLAATPKAGVDITLPEMPDDDADFSPDLARKIIERYQQIVRSLALPSVLSGVDQPKSADGRQCNEQSGKQLSPAWQPMGTFPCDGEAYLVCDDRSQSCYQIVFWDDFATSRWTLTAIDGPTYHLDAFTHWCKLPPQPHEIAQTNAASSDESCKFDGPSEANSPAAPVGDRPSEFWAGKASAAFVLAEEIKMRKTLVDALTALLKAVKAEPAMQGRQYVHLGIQVTNALSEAARRPIAWECSARKQSLPEPSDCSWPTCGCDPHADKAISALEEQGFGAPAPVDAGVREAGVDWPVYGDGEAPWSEDEQFDEQRKACKARTKQFGECGGEGDYEGQCDDCGYDAQDALRKKYRPALASSQPVVGVDQK